MGKEYKVIKKCGIYKITSPSGKIYIGQSVNIDRRFKTYMKGRAKNQTKLNASFLKYGVENHVFEVILECSVDDLNKLESYYINEFDTFNTPNGMNLRNDGHYRVYSDETRKKLSDKFLGSKNPQYGKVWTDEMRKAHGEIIRNRNYKQPKGYKLSDEIKKKMSKGKMGNKSRLGISHTIEDRKLISEKIKGRRLSKEHIENMKLSQKLSWEKRKENKELYGDKNKRMILNTQNGIFHDSLADVVKCYSISLTTLKYRLKTNGQTKFIYA